MKKRDAKGGIGELYRDLDADIARRGWKCNACGKCCRFAELGHELYCTEIEAEYLSEASEMTEETLDETCPFLREGRCSRRERRTICCRTYFCAEAGKGDMEAVTEEFLRRLRILHDQKGMPWRYARLTEHLKRRKSNSGKV